MSPDEPGTGTDPDTAMHSGSDAGPPGERPLLEEREGADGGFPEESEAAARAAADDAPLPADGGPQGDGLEVPFQSPEA